MLFALLGPCGKIAAWDFPVTRDELQSRLYSDAYDRSVVWHAQIVLWDDEGYTAAEIARMAKTTKPTVYI